MKALYEARCACNHRIRVYRDPDAWGLTFVVGSAQLGRTCTCGNGGFVFSLVSRTLREKLERKTAPQSEAGQ